MAKLLAGFREQVADQPMIGLFLDIADDLLKSVKIEERADNSIRVLAKVQFDAKLSATIEQSINEQKNGLQPTSK